MLKKRLLNTVIFVCLITIPAAFLFTPAFAKVTKITVNNHNPEMSPVSKALVAWAKKVNELCAGNAEVKVHHGGTILRGDEAFRGVQTGVVDAAIYILDKTDGFTLNSIITLPFMGWPGQIETNKIYQELMNKFPEMKAEWKGVMPYVQCMMPPTHIHNVKKVITTPGDLKGMRFHSESTLMQVISSAGGTPVDMDIADMYMSLDRGLIDGVVNHFPVLFVFGVLKILPYHTMVGEGGVNMAPIAIIWNENKWKSLSPDIQKKITGVSSVYSKVFYAGDFGLQKKTMGDAKSFGHKFNYLTPDEVKVWYKLVKEPIHDKWIQEAEAKGLPGKAVYNATLDMLK